MLTDGRNQKFLNRQIQLYKCIYLFTSSFLSHLARVYSVLPIVGCYAMYKSITLVTKIRSAYIKTRKLQVT